MVTSTGTRFGKLQLAFIGMLEFLASKMCSKHGKRVLFITSLFVYVTQLERMKADVVHKLNMVMGFTITEVNSVHLPTRISNIVWRDSAVGAVLTKELLNQSNDEERVNEVSERVVSLTPNWLRYGKAEMEKDVADLITGGRVLAAA